MTCILAGLPYDSPSWAFDDNRYIVGTTIWNVRYESPAASPYFSVSFPILIVADQIYPEVIGVQIDDIERR